MDPLLQELHDKQALHEVLMRCARGVDRLDADLLRSAYHPDTYEDHGGYYQGNANGFVEKIIADHGKFTSTMASLLNESFRVEGDTAYGECYVIAYLTKDVDGSNETTVTISGGRYFDRYERRNNEWRIAHRQVIIDFSNAKMTADLPPPGYVRSGRDKTDPTYAGFGVTS